MYAKVFEQIFDSSIAEDFTVRHLFMDLLVLADVEGCVDMTAEAISRRTNVPLDIVQKALSALCCEDPKSRTKDLEGRRLVLMDDHRDWGWKIVNYEHYRSIRDEEGRRSYMRQYMSGYRKKEKMLTPVNIRKPPLAHAEEEAEEEAEAEEGSATPPAGALFRAEYIQCIKALGDRSTGFTHQDFVALFAGTRQGLKPAEIIEEFCGAIRGEIDTRWRLYGVTRCLGYMIDDISKRYKREERSSSYHKPITKNGTPRYAPSCQ